MRISTMSYIFISVIFYIIAICRVCYERKYNRNIFDAFFGKIYRCFRFVRELPTLFHVFDPFADPLFQSVVIGQDQVYIKGYHGCNLDHGKNGARIQSADEDDKPDQ